MAVHSKFLTPPVLAFQFQKQQHQQQPQQHHCGSPSSSKKNNKLTSELLHLSPPLSLTDAAVGFEKQQHNVGTLSLLLKDTNILPQRYVVPEKDRPHLPHDAFLPQVELPVIDFSKLKSASEFENIARDVGNACRDWGFFQIVNHDVSNELIMKTEQQAKDFFSLPYQQKEKAATLPRPLGYNGRYKDLSSNAPWIEAMGMQQTPFSTVETTVKQVWPQDNPDFRQSISLYQSAMNNLGRTLVELLAISLQLEKNTFSQHFDKSWTTLRWNYYPPCPMPSRALGLLAHSDPSAITILHQDNVGGLQIRKDGQWVAVKPRPDSFIINIGDVFQAWTNGRYKSVEHRAVVNQEKARLSMVYFYGPDESTVISPPCKLIDKEHPQQYRPFTWGSYNAARLSIPAEGKRHIDVFASVDQEYHQQKQQQKQFQLA